MFACVGRPAVYPLGWQCESVGGLAAGLPGRPTAAAVARPGRAPISPPSSRRPPAKLSARPDMLSEEMEYEPVLEEEEPTAKRSRTEAESPLRTPPRPRLLRHRGETRGSSSRFRPTSPTPRAPGRKVSKACLRVPHLYTRESLFSLPPPNWGRGSGHLGPSPPCARCPG